MNLIHPPKENSIEYPNIRIYLPYTKVFPATLISLIGYNYTPVFTDPNDDYSLHKFFVNRWAEKETFIIVEHDVVVWPGAIEAIWNCESDLCLYDRHLPIHRKRVLTTEAPLACMKISKKFIEDHPNLWDKPIVWNETDIEIVKTGVNLHQHFPSVVNANPALLAFANIKEDQDGN
jgi:hypothetical protein